jgi:ABC-type protease/lipase transport system fused ATPase/permease subunit
MFWDLLTFERLMTNQVIHLIYWAGLGVIALIAFGIIGTAVGVALREELFMGILLALSVLVGGFLVVGALILLWRSFCELYVAIFRLSDDLHAMRQAVDAENSVRPPAPQGKA